MQFAHITSTASLEDPTGVAFVVPDLRGHGESDKPAFGYHVARLAHDVHELIQHACGNEKSVALVGTSMGCAIIWSFLELFGHRQVSAVVLVDQAPLQNRAPDWTLGSNGCYDAESLKRLQTEVMEDFDAFARGNAACCLVDAKRLDPALLDMLVSETKRASQHALCQLMYDHTQLDHRPLCAATQVPALVLVGRKTQIFPWQGPAYVGKLMPKATTVVFPEHDHWLYIEEPALFMKLVECFAQVPEASGLPSEVSDWLFDAKTQL
ncbi:AB hydrolase superfamily protein YdjP [Porphyridium purpureum]|uniref:AB hydrolase superfamily protein YdjP n=1 Tax=Porphyridium purpureum TaxID=35688 RepID=A0A5J4YSS9_PORPP|nr:AB hydrolase superfamily protein YdjP [Porphyridium purpureum]|eukprot:POR0051..scf236_6